MGGLLEYLQAGLPGTDLIDWENYRPTTGFMFDMVVGILPLLYLVARILLGLGSYGVVKTSRHVE